MTISKQEGEEEENDVMGADEENQVVVPEESNHNNNNSNNNNPFPEEAFYCPLTKEVFRDPVVGPDGTSYERSAIEEKENDETIIYYPNRGLAEVIQERKEQQEQSQRSMSASFQRFDKAVRDSCKKVLDKSVLGSGGSDVHPLPDAFYCTITTGLMHKPVIDPEGNTFEEAAILQWIDANHNSPITRSELHSNQLYPNVAIASLIQEETNGKTDMELHPSIRRWKQEQPTAPTYEPTTNTSSSAQGSTGSINNNFPMTLEELEERENRRRQLTCLATCFTILLVVLLLPFVGYSVLYFAFFCWCFASSSGRETQR